MKRILLLTCIGSLAVALTAFAAPKHKSHRSARGGGGTHSAHVVRGGASHVGHARTSRHFAPRHATHTNRSVAHVSRQRSHAKTVTRTARERAHGASKRTVTRGKASTGRERNATQAARNRGSKAVGEEGIVARARDNGKAPGQGERNVARQAKIDHQRNVARAAKERANRIQTAKRNARVARATRSAASRSLNAAARRKNLTMARNVLRNRAGDVRITNNWKGARFNDARYAAFRDYRREWHDRDWWHHHHSRIIFVLNGWWYWNAGYWYPAWGYDPYAWYWYDGPIYTGYADLTPDQVIINVQIALRDQGYYAGSIDGILGPQTRAAIAAYQADTGLAVTSAIDSPTLETLGLA